MYGQQEILTADWIFKYKGSGKSFEFSPVVVIKMMVAGGSSQYPGSSADNGSKVKKTASWQQTSRGNDTKQSPWCSFIVLFVLWPHSNLTFFPKFVSKHSILSLRYPVFFQQILFLPKLNKDGFYCLQLRTQTGTKGFLILSKEQAFVSKTWNQKYYWKNKG